MTSLDWLVSGPLDIAFTLSTFVTSLFASLRGYPFKSLRSDFRAGIKTQENTPGLSSLRPESSIDDVEL